MSTITVTTACGTTTEFDSRHDAEEGKRLHESLCDECSGEDVRIAADPEQTTLDPAPNGGRERERRREVSPDDGPEVADAVASMPTDAPESVRTDPLDVVPDYMITRVDGQPAINKRGYAVIANRIDIVVRSEAITTAGETDHEYAEFRATAWEKGGGPDRGYTGHGTARASEGRRGIEHNLNEMAETRAMKRAVAWASGVGLLAWEEMREYVDEG